MSQPRSIWKRLRWPLVVLAAGFCMWAATFSLLETPRISAPDTPPQFVAAPSDLVLIAHAGGGLEDGAYSNAQEAMDQAYSNGLRLFELDFSWTSDGELVALHDWAHSYEYWFDAPPLDRLRHAVGDKFGWPRAPLSLDEFMSGPMRRGLTPMDLETVLSWLSQHEDAYVVTDIKADNLKGLAKIAEAGAEMDQVIPQIYAISEYAHVRDLGYSKIILTAYRMKKPVEEVLRLAETLDLHALTIPFNETRKIPKERFDQLPFPVYTHTINDPEIAAQVFEAGVSGVYTDYLIAE